MVRSSNSAQEQLKKREEFDKVPPAVRNGHCVCILCRLLHEEQITLQDLLQHNLIQGALGEHIQIASLRDFETVLRGRGLFDTLCFGHRDLLLHGTTLDDITAGASASIFAPMQDWLKKK